MAEADRSLIPGLVIRHLGPHGVSCRWRYLHHVRANSVRLQSLHRGTVTNLHQSSKRTCPCRSTRGKLDKLSAPTNLAAHRVRHFICFNHAMYNSHSSRSSILSTSFIYGYKYMTSLLWRGYCASTPGSRRCSPGGRHERGTWPPRKPCRLRPCVRAGEPSEPCYLLWRVALKPPMRWLWCS